MKLDILKITLILLFFITTVFLLASIYNPDNYCKGGLGHLIRTEKGLMCEYGDKIYEIN